MDLFTPQYPTEFISFGSGSSGNCYMLRRGPESVLIDLGVGIRSFKRYLHQYAVSPRNVRAIFVTHDHTDHVKAVGKFAAEAGMPVYATAAVHEGMRRNRFMTRKVPDEQVRTLTVGEPVEVLGLTFTPFPVVHDSADCVGYRIESPGFTFCLATDVGSVTDDVRRAVSQADYLVLESNYDIAMLATGRYPQRLKDRITGGRGHLCNDDTADLLATSLKPGVRHVWLCHLSEENNTPDLALKTVTSRLEKAGLQPGEAFRLDALPRTRPNGFCTLD
ncbi:MAG: MBL fold metallo-hydrolase [Bacteroidaceae bacterium]|nr:MBL fold metallo-hydrolase [Bacteroidaceae bacterium]